ncbi:MAG: serine/threonine protein kinase [Bacteroidales bacterium]|nr:serine/threonine protein kinase [Bacteroidales bacterium]
MVGEYINDYEIDEIIDEGGMAIVYLGIHKVLKRRVAVKMLNPILEKNPQYKKRFINEAKLLSKLNHPNIIGLYDFVENDLGTFLITEYVKGQTLDAYVDLVSGPMPETKAVKLIVQILDAVGHMHSKNMIHRDIKPSNIMITSDNTIKLIDFGIAKHLRKNQALVTQDGAKLGTTIFMSPQQVKGKVLDRRTDIYSIGATLFYILTGQYPYDKNKSEYEIYNKIVTQPFPDPHRFYVGVSDKMRNIISKATQNQPLNRFQSCDELSIALLNTQTKKTKSATISLQTKIIDAAEIDIRKPVLGNEFKQNIIMLFAAIVFTAMIITGLYFLSKKDERQIIDNNAYLLEADSLGAKKTEKLHYGETVRIIKKPEDGIIKKPWYKVRSLRNNVGYVYADYVEVSPVFAQINAIFGNSLAGTIIPAKYKKALREFFVENRYFEDNKTSWKLYPDDVKTFELNTVAFGFFDNNDIEDFACIIENKEKEETQMLIFFDNKENISVIINEKVKIKTIEAGRHGGRWLLGNSTVRTKENGDKYEAGKYEYLKTDGILLFKQENNENIVYVYNPEEKMIRFYSQTK